MSRYAVLNPQGTKKWVFGWDPPLQSFYLQIHDLRLPEDDRIVIWLGADKDTMMPEVRDLTRASMKHGLSIHHSYRYALDREKDEGS